MPDDAAEYPSCRRCHDRHNRREDTILGKKTTDAHRRLMDAMADRLGADLDEAELRGEITPEARGDMVLSCTNCTSPEACGEWLASHDSAEDAPEYCRNGRKLRALRGD